MLHASGGRGYEITGARGCQAPLVSRGSDRSVILLLRCAYALNRYLVFIIYFLGICMFLAKKNCRALIPEYQTPHIVTSGVYIQPNDGVLSFYLRALSLNSCISWRCKESQRLAENRSAFSATEIPPSLQMECICSHLPITLRTERGINRHTKKCMY